MSRFIFKMNNKRFGLTELDRYAKRISTKQVGMLYESRMHKKYKKRLYESLTVEDAEELEDCSNVYVTNDAAINAGYTPAELIADAVKIDKSVSYRKDNNGMYLFSILPDVYDELKGFLDDKDVEYTESVVD